MFSCRKIAWISCIDFQNTHAFQSGCNFVQHRNWCWWYIGFFYLNVQYMHMFGGYSFPIEYWHVSTIYLFMPVKEFSMLPSYLFIVAYTGSINTNLNNICQCLLGNHSIKMIGHFSWEKQNRLYMICTFMRNVAYIRLRISKHIMTCLNIIWFISCFQSVAMGPIYQLAIIWNKILSTRGRFY